MFVRQAKNFVPTARGVLLVSNRSVTRTHYMSAPPMRLLNPFQRIGLFFFVFGSFFAYPLYVLLNLDNVRPFQKIEFNDELKEKLEERRRLRAEGKLNVLQKKL